MHSEDDLLNSWGSLRNTEKTNLLPFDGEVFYLGKIFSQSESTKFYQELMQKIEWKNDEAHIFGKHYITKRKVAWYGEKPFSYTYSRSTKTALLWTPELLKIKSRVEEKLSEKFNSCLLNLYHNGNEGMAWHSDSEKELKKHGVIASVSFGAERKFSFKSKQTKQRIDLFLEEGSLMVMKGKTQDNWLHRLPQTTKVSTPRINLTFRFINH